MKLLLPGRRKKRLDWYVDSVSGNDANSGKSAGAAFRTIGALSGKIAAGNRIGLAKGSVWREQMTISANNVSVIAYGNGAKPLLDCSEVALNASFSKTAGQTYVYQLDITPDIAVAKTWVGAWENDVRLVRAASIAACNSTPGSVYPSKDTGTGTVTIYIHAGDDSDVTANGKTYEYTKRQTGIEASSVTAITVNGIAARRNLHEDGSVKLFKYAHLVDCLFTDGSKHNVIFSEGANIQNCECSEAYYGAGSGVMFCLYTPTTTGINTTLSGCYAHCTNFISTIGAFETEQTAGAGYGVVVFDSCRAVNVGTGFALMATSMSTTISNCTVTGCDGGVRLDYVTPLTVRDSAISVLDRAITFNVAGATITVDNCTLTGSVASGAHPIYTTIESSTIIVTRTRFVGNGNTSFVWATGASVNLTMNNCTVVAPIYGLRDIGTGDTYVGDYNTYPVGLHFRYNGSDLMLAAWQAATGQDVHSTG